MFPDSDKHSRRDNRTKPSSFDSDSRFRQPTNIHNLLPDMFSFPITIRPDHQQVGSSGFILKVSSDGL